MSDYNKNSFAPCAMHSFSTWIMIKQNREEDKVDGCKTCTHKFSTKGANLCLLSQTKEVCALMSMWNTDFSFSNKVACLMLCLFKIIGVKYRRENFAFRNLCLLTREYVDLHLDLRILPTKHYNLPNLINVSDFPTL